MSAVHFSVQSKSGRRRSEDSSPVSLPPASATSPHKVLPRFNVYTYTVHVQYLHTHVHCIMCMCMYIHVHLHISTCVYTTCMYTHVHGIMCMLVGHVDLLTLNIILVCVHVAIGCQSSKIYFSKVVRDTRTVCVSEPLRLL